VANFKHLETTRSNQIPFRNKLMQTEFQECLLLFGFWYFVYLSQFKNRSIEIYRTVTLTFVLYGCGTLPLTLMEVHRLKILENVLLREIFRPKGDVKTGEWRRPTIKELHGFYSSLNFIPMIKWRTMRWAVHVARCKRREVDTVIWWGDVREKHLMEDLRQDGIMILTWILR